MNRPTVGLQEIIQQMAVAATHLGKAVRVARFNVRPETQELERIHAELREAAMRLSPKVPAHRKSAGGKAKEAA